MRLPILYALAYPERVDASVVPGLHFDLAALSQLDFSAPDLARFPCLRLAYEAAETGGNACIALNAADEIAVAAFLEGRIPFVGIPRTIEQVLMQTPGGRPSSIDEVLEADIAARTCAREMIANQLTGVR
jgi:1-deoxy-D-xylulose-5-phosphate reductoisomerase